MVEAVPCQEIRLANIQDDIATLMEQSKILTARGCSWSSYILAEDHARHSRHQLFDHPNGKPLSLPNEILADVRREKFPNPRTRVSANDQRPALECLGHREDLVRHIRAVNG